MLMIFSLKQSKFSYKSLVIVLVAVLMLHSCKNNSKTETPTNNIPVDTTAVSNVLQSIDLPHADTAVIPVLTQLLDQAFTAAAAKDYNTLGKLIVYRGENAQRHGYDVFNATNAYERKVVLITAGVMNKWKSSSESVDYARAFQLPQPDGRTMMVLEVYFVSKKFLDRKFFGFLEVNGAYKIADITSEI